MKYYVWQTSDDDSGFTFLPRLRRLRDECVRNMSDAVRSDIVAAVGGDTHHSNLYQLMQMLVEANSISQQLNKHIVGLFVVVKYCIQWLCLALSLEHPGFFLSVMASFIILLLATK